MGKVRMGYTKCILWLLAFISVTFKLFRLFVYIAVAIFKVNDGGGGCGLIYRLCKKCEDLGVERGAVQQKELRPGTRSTVRVRLRGRGVTNGNGSSGKEERLEETINLSNFLH
jgi:hypothetical protein